MVRPDFGVRYQDTYAYLIQTQLKDTVVINASVRANSSQNVLSANYCYDTFDAVSPDLIIYFLGIVDCMPRLFSIKERLLLRLLMATKFLRSIGKFIISYRSKRRYKLTKKRLIQYVPIKIWNENLENFLMKISRKVIFVNIPYPGKRLLSRNYEIEDIVNNYNACLVNQAQKHGATIIDFYTLTKQSPHLLLEDGYHITAEAHKVLSEAILESITNFKKAN